MNLPSDETRLSQIDGDERMDPAFTALVLVGLQNESFASDGGLRGDLDSGEAADHRLLRPAGRTPDRPVPDTLRE